MQISLAGRLSGLIFLIILVVAFLWLNTDVYAVSLPAFPGAEGFGSTTPGGRGGRVIHVTNLNASGTGSLREALLTTGPRMVVFDVSGIIDLGPNGHININGGALSYLTVAGQTAPGDGILVRGAIRLIDVHDVVLRYIRIRKDDPGCLDVANNCPAESSDGLELNGEIYNVVIDHMSISWATDENISFYNNAGNGKDIRNVTFQWNIIAEGDADSTHPESGKSNGSHSMGILLANRSFTEYVENVTIHHNLFIHNNDRNPLHLRGTSPQDPDPRGIIRFLNNVVYNWGRTASIMNPHDGGIMRFDYINNYYKAGPSTLSSQKHPIWCYTSDGSGICRVYQSGNVFSDNGQEVQTALYLSHGAAAVISSQIVANPIGNDGVYLESAHNAYAKVAADAGTILPMNNLLSRTASVRDMVDNRLISELANGTGRVGIANNNVRSWPTLSSATAPIDTDRDGMPDSWESERRMNPNANDSALDRNTDGYTNIEEYINSLIPAIFTPSIKDLLSTWTLPASDQNGDGKTNSLDFALVSL